MWMTEYIWEINRQFVAVYGYPENPDRPGVPVVGSVPDGEYPMEIGGKVDHVKIEDGRIHCLNFESKASQQQPLSSGGE